MTITCNGTPSSTDARTVTELLAERLGDPAPPGVAVAVDGAVVPRTAWPAARIGDGSVVEIVTAVQGG